MAIVYQNGIAGKICANPECSWKPLSEFAERRIHGKSAGDGYKSRCRDCWNAQSRAERTAKLEKYRAIKLEHCRAIGRKSREKHAEERNAYQRDYGKANRNKLTLFTNNRRARKLQAIGSHTDKEWQELKVFYNFTCLRCGKQEPEIKLTRDHVIPLIQGGADSIDNIQPLCAQCNSKKNNKHIDYR